MSGHKPAEPNQKHLRDLTGGPDVDRSTQILRQLETMLDDADPETLDVDKLESLLDELQERAPVMEDFDPACVMADLQRDHPALFEPEEAAPPSKPEKAARPGRTRRILLRVGAAAALLVILCVSAGAFGFPPFRRLIDWASEIMQINRNPSGAMELPEDSGAEYLSLEDAMLANGVEPVGIPTWIPKDYSLNTISVFMYEDTLKIFALYMSESRGELLIRVTQYPDTTFSYFEKESDGGYTYPHNETDYDIVENLDSVNIEWQISNCVYSVTGKISLEEAELIIKSVDSIG